MKVRSTVLLLSLFWLVNGLSASEAVDRAHKYEDAGDSAAAREVYSKALQANPNDPELLTGYAQILERYKNPGARDAYRKSAALWKNAGRTQDALRSARRAVLLDLIAGDRAAVQADFATYSALGGTDLQLPLLPAGGVPKQSISIPGPIRSFARMAALSPDIQPDNLLAALARNVVTNGYQASHANELTGGDRISQARASVFVAGA
jgi:tetratricopeptide (TPR) repeat protein